MSCDRYGQFEFESEHDHRNKPNQCCNHRILMYIDDGNLFDSDEDDDWFNRPSNLCKRNCKKPCPHTQFHDHELQGSVEFADNHNHRFAAVTGEARFVGGNNHVHDVWFRTDFSDEHFHEAKGTTGFAIQVGDRHVHFLDGVTTFNDGHLHKYRVATMIESPTD